MHQFSLPTQHKIHIYLLVSLVYATTILLLGCGGIYTFSSAPKELIYSADDAYEAAEAGMTRWITPKTETAHSDKQELFKTAIDLYQQAIDEDTKRKKYTKRDNSLRANHEIAKIFLRLYDFNNCMAYSSNVIALADKGYYATKAKERLENIGTQLKIIKAQRSRLQEYQAKFHEYKAKHNQASSEHAYNSAAESLYRIAQAYESLEDFPQAIRTYQEIVEDYPKYENAPKAQFRIGNIYFYDLYDYTNEGGWGAFVLVHQKFPASEEAKKIVDLLNESDKIFKTILHLQRELERIKEKSPRFFNTDRRVLSGDVSDVVRVSADQIISIYQEIAQNWIKMRNYPRAIQALKTVSNGFPLKVFSVKEALNTIAKLQMQMENYDRAIHTYNTLFQIVSQSFEYSDGEPLYNQGICYHKLQRYTKAYKTFKKFLRLKNKEPNYIRQAEQIIRELEQDEDKDGFRFYVEADNGTSDQDPNSHP